MNTLLNKHVLIVEDSEDIQELLRTLLEAKGCTIDCRSNGLEAMRFLNESVKLPDAILLDLNMPVMDGHAFLKLKVKSARLRNIPTIVMSGDYGIDFERDGINVPDVLTKPLNASSLIEAVRRNAF